MNCETFQLRLQQLLDQRLPPEYDVELVAHSLVCESCHQQLYLQHSVFSLLKSDESSAPSVDFTDRVMREVSSTMPLGNSPRELAADAWVMGKTRISLDARPNRRVAPAARRKFRLANWGVVLTVCLALYLLGQSLRQENVTSGLVETASNSPRSAPHEQVHGEFPSRQPPLAPIAASEPSEESWADSPGRNGPFVFPIAESMDQAASPSYQFWLAALTAQLPDVPPNSLQSVDQIAGGLRPVAVSFGAALETIRRSLPIVDRDDRPVKPQAAVTSGLLVG